MQKTSRLLFVALFALTYIGFAGCKKIPVITKPPDNVELCNINRTHYTFAGQNSDANFTYNAYGKPLSVSVSNSGTGNPNVIFLYDKYQRLTDYIGPYSKLDPANLPNNISFEFWIRYTYSDQNPASMPVADTSRTFGNYSNGQFNVITPVNIERYTYDSDGRIIQINSMTFNYNAQGNLVLPGVTYDDRIHFRRTNKIWMFVDRNFSVNNPFIATSYNDKGLPTTFPNSYTMFMHRGLYLSSMDYLCTSSFAD